MKYEYIKTTNVISAHIRKTDENGDVWFIPIDESNSDYQQYLRDTKKK